MANERQPPISALPPQDEAKMALVAPAEHPPAERAGRSVGGRVNGRTNGGLARKAGAPSGPVPLTF